MTFFHILMGLLTKLSDNWWKLELLIAASRNN